VHTLGHAIFEVGLQPHLGWCGKALLLDVDTGFFQLDEPPSARLDDRLATLLADDDWLASPRQLWPLPCWAYRAGGRTMKTRPSTRIPTTSAPAGGQSPPASRSEAVR
jgi:hypothetical protein